MIQTNPRDWITRDIATKTKTNKMGVKKIGSDKLLSFITWKSMIYIYIKQPLSG